MLAFVSIVIVNIFSVMRASPRPTLLLDNVGFPIAIGLTVLAVLTALHIGHQLAHSRIAEVAEAEGSIHRIATKSADAITGDRLLLSMKVDRVENAAQALDQFAIALGEQGWILDRILYPPFRIEGLFAPFTPDEFVDLDVGGTGYNN